MVKLWNYSKDPARGVSLFELWVDHWIVFRGEARRADPSADGGAADAAGQAVLFTNDARLAGRERKTCLYCGAKEQDVMCVNEGAVMKAHKGVQHQDPRAEGFRSSSARPKTAMVHPRVGARR
jgi:hypothetical protein